jgi:hypothetical protein
MLVEYIRSDAMERETNRDLVGADASRRTPAPEAGHNPLNEMQVRLMLRYGFSGLTYPLAAIMRVVDSKETLRHLVVDVDSGIRGVIVERPTGVALLS